MRSPQRIVASLLLAASSALATAADFDGSRPFLCSPLEAHDCVSGSNCRPALARDLNLPAFIKVDFAGRTISAQGRTSPIQNASRADGKLFIQGIDNARAFGLVIDESTGALVGAIAADEEAFVVFGECTLN
jgi:hypothetical protein